MLQIVLLASEGMRGLCDDEGAYQGGITDRLRNCSVTSIVSSIKKSKYLP